MIRQAGRKTRLSTIRTSSSRRYRTDCGYIVTMRPAAKENPARVFVNSPILL